MRREDRRLATPPIPAPLKQNRTKAHHHPPRRLARATNNRTLPIDPVPIIAGGHDRRAQKRMSRLVQSNRQVTLDASDKFPREGS